MTPYTGKLAIVTHFYNYFAYSPYVRSLATTIGLLSALGIKHEYIMRASDFHIERAGNNTWTELMESGEFTDILNIDSDHSWDAADVVRLLLHPEEIVGASYRMKNSYEQYVGTIKYKDGHPDGKLLKDGTPLLRADRVAGGFMRVKVSALRKWAAAYPDLISVEPDGPKVQFFLRGIQDGYMACPDMEFCRRWTDIGGELWIDPNIKVDHWGFEKHPGDLNAFLRRKHSGVEKAFAVVAQMAADIKSRAECDSGGECAPEDCICKKPTTVSAVAA